MKMTIDEAINRYESNAEYERTHESLQGCLEFRQLAEWLKEYKRLLGAIDAINAEIESAKYLNYGQQYYLVSGLNKALEIINKHTSGGDANAVSD